MHRAEDVTLRLGGTWFGTYGKAPDVGHSPKDDGLSIKDGDDGLIVYSHHGYSYDEIMGYLRDKGVDCRNNRKDRNVARRQTRNADASNTGSAQAIWRSSSGVVTPYVDAYLRRRGLNPSAALDLREHGSLYHGPTRGSFPAMVAAVKRWPSDDVLAIHRTYLDHAAPRKAPVVPAKMMLGPCRGGAVRLSHLGETLAIAEGIETALSYQELFKTPCWAALSCAQFEHFVVPDGVRELIFVLDNDANRASFRAYERAAERLWRMGLKIYSEVCPLPYPSDFNDLLMSLTDECADQ
ncbi:MAG: toprim domain-containing protein [Pseudomonadota bacterium]